MVNGGLFSLSFHCFQNAIEDPIGVLELGIPENISPWLKGLPMPVNSTPRCQQGVSAILGAKILPRLQLKKSMSTCSRFLLSVYNGDIHGNWKVVRCWHGRGDPCSATA